MTAQRSTSIYYLFKKQLEKFAHKVAVKFLDKSLTYDDLFYSSLKIANTINLLTANKSITIGIHLDKSEKIVQAILGAMFSKGRYVFIDPQYPEQRNEYIIANSNINVLLTDNEHYNYYSGISRINIDEITDTNDNREQLIKDVESFSEKKDILYIMYTSGSTGNPKGVMITEENVIHYIYAINEVLQLKSNDHCLHTASFSFSSSIRQLLTPLLNGATLYISNKENTSSLESLFDFIKKHSITYIDTVQSLWTFGIDILESGGNFKSISNDLNSLNRIVFSGDALPVKVVNWIRLRMHDSVRIINLYGQTETIGGIYFEIPVNFNKTSGITPIGIPLSHINAYILDLDFKPVNDNEIGEIYISGASVGKGYYNNVTETGKYFLNNCFTNNKDDILYKTGDIAKLNNNLIEIQGRIDYQIKIRGQRVESLEIESALEELPEIEKCIVTLEDKEQGYLSAYLSVNNKPGRRRIINFLKKRIPEHMIPAMYYVVDKLPLTTNGKIDRKMIHQSVSYLIEDANDSEPVTDTEKELLDIFRNVLNNKSFGVNSNFFEYGGHSLSALQIIISVNSSFGCKIDFKTIHSNPTVKQLASSLQEISVKHKIPTITKTNSSNSEFPVTHIQRWMYQNSSFKPEKFNSPTLVKFKNRLDVRRVREIFNEIISRHQILRSSFSLKNEQVVLSVNSDVNLKVDRKECFNAELDKKIQQINTPFKLNDISLMRVTLISTESTDYIFLNLHHIISDGGSKNIILKEFIDIYEGIVLNPVEFQFQDYSTWYQEVLQNNYFEYQKTYWINKLKGFRLTTLPYDNADCNDTNQSFSTLQINIPKVWFKNILSNEVIKRKGFTCFTFILSAFVASIQKLSNQNDITFLVRNSNRYSAQLNNTIGCFLNALLYRVVLDKELNPMSYLEYIKNTIYESLDNSFYPFQLIQPELVDFKGEIFKGEIPIAISYMKEFDDVYDANLIEDTNRKFAFKETVLESDQVLIMLEKAEHVEITHHYRNRYSNKTIDAFYEAFRSSLESFNNISVNTLI